MCSGASVVRLLQIWQHSTQFNNQPNLDYCQSPSELFFAKDCQRRLCDNEGTRDTCHSLAKRLRHKTFYQANLTVRSGSQFLVSIRTPSLQKISSAACGVMVPPFFAKRRGKEATTMPLARTLRHIVLRWWLPISLL